MVVETLRHQLSSDTQAGDHGRVLGTRSESALLSAAEEHGVQRRVAQRQVFRVQCSDAGSVELLHPRPKKT